MTGFASKERFHSWLLDMDDSIERFVRSAPPEIRSKLDGTVASLHPLELWLLMKYSRPGEALARDQASFIDGAARYLGEIFRLSTGSNWGIQLDDRKDVFFGVPTLTGGLIGGTPVCPLTTITASTDRRTGKFFSTILNNLAPDSLQRSETPN